MLEQKNTEQGAPHPAATAGDARPCQWVTERPLLLSKPLLYHVTLLFKTALYRNKSCPGYFAKAMSQCTWILSHSSLFPCEFFGFIFIPLRNGGRSLCMLSFLTGSRKDHDNIQRQCPRQVSVPVVLPDTSHGPATSHTPAASRFRERDVLMAGAGLLGTQLSHLLTRCSLPHKHSKCPRRLPGWPARPPWRPSVTQRQQPFWATVGPPASGSCLLSPIQMASVGLRR